MSRARIETDAEYLWALEVLVCYYTPDRREPSSGDVQEARRIVKRNNLKRPMDKVEEDW